MIKFVAGDVMQSGITNMDSVKKCLQMVVGKHTASDIELDHCDFNFNGQIDLDDTFKILQIAELTKHPLYIHGKDVCIDRDMINGKLLGVFARFNTNLTATTNLDSNWTFISHQNVIYVENIANPSFQHIICSVPCIGCIITYFEIVFEKNGKMFYTLVE